MKTSVIRIISIIACVVFAGLFFNTCINPIGLGHKVNTTKPDISIDDPDSKPGAFLQGSDNTIVLDVEQEFGLREVYITLQDYYDTDGVLQQNIKLNAEQGEDGRWRVKLDTIALKIPDGKLEATVTAIDTSGNITVTPALPYYVKNIPPQIKLNIPAVTDDDFDKNDFLDTLKFTDPVYQGFDLMGLATDDYGIEIGYPKIMFWPADLAEVDNEGLPLGSNIDNYPMPYDKEYGYYRTMVMPANVKDGATATKFTWPMVSLVKDDSNPSGYRLPEKSEISYLPISKYYRFRIIVKDKFGNVNYYPDRTDKTDQGDNSYNKKYVEICYQAPGIPTFSITDIPSFYNRVGDLTVKMYLSSSNPLKEIKASIYDNAQGTGMALGTYTIPDEPDEKTNEYTLTIPGASARSWNWDRENKGNTLYVFPYAKDSEDNESVRTYRSFIIDDKAPAVTIDRPNTIANVYDAYDDIGWGYKILRPAISINEAESPNWVTSLITVGGKCDDGVGASGVKKVYYHIGKMPSPDDGSITHLERKAIYDNPDNWTDTKLDTPTPMEGWTGSVYAPSYNYDFNNYKSSFPELVQSSVELGYSSANEDWYSTETTRDNYNKRFYLPFFLKVEDIAGNVQIIHYTLCIDPELDKPQVNINYPLEGDMVGGAVRLSGAATDNDWIHTVLIRVLKPKNFNAAGEPIDFPNTFEYYYPKSTQLYYTGDNASKPAPNGDTAGWFEASKSGSAGPMINWYYNLNEDGGLTSEDFDKQPVLIQVVAIDSLGNNTSQAKQAGKIYNLNVTFNAKVPTIEDLTIRKIGVTTGGNYSGKEIITSGKFVISMKIGAIPSEYNENLTFHTIQARFNQGAWKPIITNGIVAGGLTVGSIGTAPGWYLSEESVTANKRSERILTIVVDSTNQSDPVIPGIGWGKTSNQTLEVQVKDYTVPTALEIKGTYTFGIDNYYPSTEISTRRVAFDNPSYFPAEGIAKDSGTGSGEIQGLDKILIYFEKANITYNSGKREVTGSGNYIRPNGDLTEPTDFMTRSYVRDDNQNDKNGPNGPNVDSFGMFPQESPTVAGTYPAAIVINEKYAQGAEPSNGSNVTWLGLVEKTWNAQLHTTLLPDGPYIVHYIVMDNAENATHYSKDIYVENNKPVITGITLGTNIGDVDIKYMDPTEVFDDSRGGAKIFFENPSFRVRNKNFSVKLSAKKGNNNRTATVSYVTALADIEANTMIKGNVYTIVKMNSTDFTLYGALNNQVGTTFVASDAPSSGTNLGIVTPYEIKEFDSKDFGPASGESTNTETIVFEKFSNIEDSHKDVYGDVDQHNKKLFIVKIYDTTVTGGTENDQLASAVLVAIDIDNTDQKAPTIKSAPFGQEYVLKAAGDIWANDSAKMLKDVSNDSAGYNKNIVLDTSTNTRQGYVQYAYDDNGVTDGTADISGKVVFLGKAEDNQRIKNITVTIPGFNGGNPIEVASAPPEGGMLTSKRSEQSGIGSGNNAWYFEIVDQYLTLDYGHALNWKFGWDSSLVANTSTGINVTFRINDFTSSNTNDTARTVKIAPYISEVITPLSSAYASSPSAFARSALGGYPVREGDEITIKGFNLGTSVKVGNTALSSVTTVTGGIKGTIPNSVESGPLVVTNVVESLNNTGRRKYITTSNTNIDNRVYYNWEPNGVNNNILDNSRYIYVWTTGYIDDHASSTIINPFMRITANSTLLLSYGYYPSNSQGRLNVKRNNNLYQAAFAQYNRMFNTTVAGNTNNSWYAMGSDSSTGSGQTLSYPFYFGRSAADGTGTATSTSSQTVTPAPIEIVHLLGANNNRFKIPRIVVQSPGTSNRTSNNNGGDRVLISYYDADKKEVRIIYGNTGAGTDSSGITASTDGNSSSSSVVVADSSTGKNGGMYTAVGFLNNGLPLIAWYDETNNKLYFSWESGVTDNISSPVTTSIPTTYTYSSTSARIATDKTRWQNNAVQVGTDTYKGAHVDMAVDSSNNVHLAYYDVNNGGLYYALIPPTKSGNGTDVRPNTSNITSVKVDTFLSAGTKIMINVRGTTPYITYFHGSFTETKNSVRVAWLKSATLAAGTDINDMFTGKWEVMTVPVQNVPVSGEFICNGVPSSGTLQGTGLSKTDVTKSIVIGYQTNVNYEGAVLKDDMSAGLAAK